MLIPESAIQAVDRLTNEVRVMRESGGLPIKHEFDPATTGSLALAIFMANLFALLIFLAIYAKIQANNRKYLKP